MITDIKSIEDSLGKRVDALHQLGFNYDADIRLFVRECSGSAPLILSLTFVSEVPNEAFFKEYYRLRGVLRKLERNSDCA